MLLKLCLLDLCIKDCKTSGLSCFSSKQKLSLPLVRHMEWGVKDLSFMRGWSGSGLACYFTKTQSLVGPSLWAWSFDWKLMVSFSSACKHFGRSLGSPLRRFWAELFSFPPPLFQSLLKSWWEMWLCLKQGLLSLSFRPPFFPPIS